MTNPCSLYSAVIWRSRGQLQCQLSNIHRLGVSALTISRHRTQGYKYVGISSFRVPLKYHWKNYHRSRIWTSTNMATASKIVLSTSHKPEFHTSNWSSEAAAKASELLQENHE